MVEVVQYRHYSSKYVETVFFLSASEYADLVRCPMEGDDYEKLIRKRFLA